MARVPKSQGRRQRDEDQSLRRMRECSESQPSVTRDAGLDRSLEESGKAANEWQNLIRPRGCWSQGPESLTNRNRQGRQNVCLHVNLLGARIAGKEPVAPVGIARSKVPPRNVTSFDLLAPAIRGSDPEAHRTVRHHRIIGHLLRACHSKGDWGKLSRAR